MVQEVLRVGVRVGETDQIGQESLQTQILGIQARS